MKTLTALCFMVLMSACAPVMDSLTGAGQEPDKDPAELRLFVEGIDRIFRDQDPQLLQQLKDRYPDSPWAERADDVLARSARLKQQQQQLDELSADRQPALIQERIDHCLAENQRLQKELGISNQRLEALRELTIELELKQP